MNPDDNTPQLLPTAALRTLLTTRLEEAVEQVERHRKEEAVHSMQAMEWEQAAAACRCALDRLNPDVQPATYDQSKPYH